MAEISHKDISYKYMPISIFDVQKMGKKGIFRYLTIESFLTT